MAVRTAIEKLRDHGCLLIQGPVSEGCVSAVTDFISRNSKRIESLEQFTESSAGEFMFLRLEFKTDGLSSRLAEIRGGLAALLDPLGMSWSVSDLGSPQRMIVLASKSDHCLLELLWRHARGELPVDIPMIISNHRDVEESVRQFGIPFHHVPSQGADKSAAEAAIIRLVAGQADFLVLARYMQILSPDFLEDVGVPIINIHHSFLPAFVGAGPYQRAKERGVKMIGATAHYVTVDLDEGPIIEQDIARVNHAHSAEALQERGQYVERAVLSRAVQWHTERRVIRHGNQTVIFA